MKTALAVVAGIVLLGVLATTAVYAWSAYTLLVFMFQVMGGAA
ncbi:hypothetical protein [Microbacterium sp.]